MFEQDKKYRNSSRKSIEILCGSNWADKIPPRMYVVLEYPCDECGGPRLHGYGYQCRDYARCKMFLCHKCAGERHEILRHVKGAPKYSEFRLRRMARKAT